MVDFRFRPFQHFVERLAGLEQVADRPDDGVADGGDALGVDLLEPAFRIFGAEFRHGLVHRVEGVGHRAGEVHVEHVVAGGEFRLEVFEVTLFRDGAGGGQDAAAQDVVEGPAVEFGEVDVRVDGFGVDAVGHADELVAIFSGDGGGNVGVSVSIEGQHSRRI